MAKEEIDATFRVLLTILGGAVGGLVIMVIGNRLRIASDAAQKRKKFRSDLRLLRRRISAHGADHFLIDPEARECQLVDIATREARDCIRCHQHTRFDTSVAKYKAVVFHGSGQAIERQKYAETANRKAKDELLFYLDELDRCAWWAV